MLRSLVPWLAVAERPAPPPSRCSRCRRSGGSRTSPAIGPVRLDRAPGGVRASKRRAEYRRTAGRPPDRGSVRQVTADGLSGAGKLCFGCILERIADRETKQHPFDALNRHRTERWRRRERCERGWSDAEQSVCNQLILDGVHGGLEDEYARCWAGKPMLSLALVLFVAPRFVSTNRTLSRRRHGDQVRILQSATSATGRRNVQRSLLQPRAEPRAP